MTYDQWKLEDGSQCDPKDEEIGHLKDERDYLRERIAVLEEWQKDAISILKEITCSTTYVGNWAQRIEDLLTDKEAIKS